MADSNDIPSILEIDRDRLDYEWVRQPELYFEYALQLANANEELDDAKTELELVEAELDLAIRNDPEAYEVPKVTESSVKATILTQKEYKVAVKALRNAKHAVDVLKAAVTALDHRKKALESLVYLHGQNYFASPQAPNDDNSREYASNSKKAAARSTKKKRASYDDD